MYVRRCYRAKNGKRHAYWALVESWKNAGVGAVHQIGFAHVYRGQHADAEVMPRAEVKAKPVRRDIVATVAAALRPTAMLGGPMLRAILLKRTAPLPRAAALPSVLLLPRLRLLL